MASDTAVKLESLAISEVSGVDDPANEAPGFMVLKAEDPDTSVAEDDSTLVDRLKSLFLGAPPTAPEGDIEMKPEELAAVLDERIAPLADKVEELSKSVTEPAPAAEGAAPVTEPETPAAPAAEAMPSVEDIAKAVEAALEGKFSTYNDILEKAFDRLENVERALTLGARKSLVGQEGGDTVEAPQTPDLADAIVKALRTPSSVRVVEAKS